MRVLIIVVSLLFLAGCGSTPHHKQFDLSKVEARQGVIIGKINVEYNSVPFPTAGCTFCVDLDCHRLLQEGYVFMPIGRGDVYNTFFTCSYPVVGRGDHVFKVDSFAVKPGVTYFGNLLFSVNSRVTRVYKFYDSFQRKTVEETQYELTSTVSVSDHISGAVEAFRRQVKHEKAQVEKNLFDVSDAFTTQEIHVEH